MIPDRKIDNGRRTDKKTTLRLRSLDEMRDSLAWAIANDRNDSSVSGSESFTETKSADEYLSMLRDGWQEGIEGVEELDGLSTDRAEKICFERSPGGAFPVVPAYLAGAPDSMLRPVPQQADSVRGLTLVIDSSFNCMVNAKDCKEYAHSVMRLLAWLQAEQIETAVYSVITIADGSMRMLYAVPIREAGDIMQPERIAAVVHPSFLRRAWFAQVEREYHEHQLPGTGMCTGGYGYPQTATTEELKQALPDSYSVILLPKVGDGDPEKAVRETITLKLRHEE